MGLNFDTLQVSKSGMDLPLEGIMDRVVTLISFSMCLLFVYLEATDFYALIWQPAIFVCI